MNQTGLRPIALLALGLILLFGACEKPTDNLGFDQIIGNTVEADTLELPLVKYTAPVDSILVAFRYQDQLALGGYSSTRLMGRYQSSYFGSAQAEMLAQIFPDQVNPDFGSNPVLDSVFLNLRTTGAYGDTTAPMHLAVYELDEGFSRDSIYYSNYDPGATRLLGELLNYSPRPRTAVRFNETFRAPFIRIPLDREYFQERFVSVGNGSYEPFSTFDNFIEYFKGLKVSALSGECILSLNLASAFSNLQLHYHNDTDTGIVEFNFDQDRSLVPITFSRFEQDYENALFDLKAQDTVLGEQQTYVQAMGGVTTALKIDPRRMDSLSRAGLIVNRARLQLSTAVGTGDPAAPAQALEIRILEGRHLGSRILDFQDNRGDGELRLGVLRANRYQFDLTRHLFNVLNSGENNTLAIVPVSRTTSASRTILRGGENAEAPAKLIVYYTKP